MDVLWIHKLAEVIKKPTSRRKLWKNAFFLPCCSVPVIYVFLYLYIYLQSPEVIQSSDPPQPIALLSAYLSTYIILYIYVFIFIFIHLPAITCSHSKFRPSPTYCPTVLFIYVYIYIYIYLFLFIFTCNHLQSA